MPLYRYRTFEEAEQDLHRLPTTGRFVFNLADRIGNAPCSRGLFRFRTLEEANEHRREEELSARRERREGQDS